jgi:hypothetical protein
MVHDMMSSAGFEMLEPIKVQFGPLAGMIHDGIAQIEVPAELP